MRTAWAIGPPEIDHAWAAGFIDGEGYIYAHPRVDRNGRPEVGVQVYQQNRAPLEKLQRLYGGSIAVRDGRGVRRDGWSWRMHGGEGVRRMLPAILPYLVVKRADAERVLAVAQTIPAKGHKPT